MKPVLSADITHEPAILTEATATLTADAWSRTRIRNINECRSPQANLLTLSAKHMLMPTWLGKQSTAMCDIYATVMLCGGLSNAAQMKSVHQDSCLPSTATKWRCSQQQNMKTRE